MREELTWPAERLGEALEILGRRARLSAPRERVLNPDAQLDLGRSDKLGRWVEQTAAWLGFEAQSVYAHRREIGRLLGQSHPALFRIAGQEGPPRFVAMLRGGRRDAVLIGPDFVERTLPRGQVRTLVCAPIEATILEQIEPLLDDAKVAAPRRTSAREHLVEERLGLTPITDAWVLGLAPHEEIWAQAKSKGIPARVAGFVAVETAYYALWLASWWLIGRGALAGHLDPGWLMAWGLLLFTLIPMRLLGDWWQATAGVAAGSLLKQRLLYGALRLDTSALRRRGAGQLMSTVFESEAVERLALGGGSLGLVALVELAFGFFVLAAGAGGWPHAALLVVWLVGAVLVARRYMEARRQWTGSRLSLTERLVERMIGHRTVIAQEGARGWSSDHDRQLDGYMGDTVGLDRSLLALLTFLSRGWLAAGLIGLAPALLAADVTLGQLAISIGGTLLAARSLRKLAFSTSYLGSAMIAARAMAPLLDAAGQAELVATPDVENQREGRGEKAQSAILLEAREIAFRHEGRVDPTLKSCDLTIERGGRILLTGESGSGKSTLAAVLCGMRLPASGALLLRGLDLKTLGEQGWRRGVTGVFQFHENHIVTETLAFNLLMGRRWPATPEDFEDAERVCRDIGLGPLLDRMPSGLLQTVGETGWQLSHGERSRVYIARALLQTSDVTVLDESFGALDPDALRLTMDVVQRSSRALVVIAHP